MTWEDRLIATVLSADAIATRRSAAALYGLLPAPADVDVVVRRGRRNLDRVRVHSSLDLPETDITSVGPIPATTPVRTLIDVGAELRGKPLERLVDRAVTRQLVRIPALERRALELRAPGRPGAARVLRALATAHPDLARARNEFEATVLRLSRAAHLPDPIPNHPVIVGGRRRILDAAWCPSLVCLEFDGYTPHTESRDIFDDDRARQNDLVDAGWIVFRITAAMLGRDARREFAKIRRAVLSRNVSQRSITSEGSV